MLVLVMARGFVFRQNSPAKNALAKLAKTYLHTSKPQSTIAITHAGEAGGFSVLLAWIQRGFHSTCAVEEPS